MKKILFILNSDFGIQNTIGARAKPIIEYSQKKDKFIILCRDYDKNLKFKLNIKKVFPLSNILMKFFTFLQIYVSEKIPTGEIKNYIFEFFLKQKLKKIDFKDIKLIHSWDFLPNIYKYIKQKNKKTKIFQDVPMALPNVISNLIKKDNLWENKDINIKKYVKESLKYVDYFVVPSNFVKDSLLKEGIKENKILLVPFGVDIQKFKPLKNKELNKKFKVAFSGNINKRKGISYLIQAWKELNLKNAELNIYGRVYPEVKDYLKNFEKYNVVIHGFIDLTKEIPKNNIYVFPSLLEGSAKSVYEAMACGLPIITTYNAGSVIQNGKEGFIIPVQDVNSIKEKILFFYNNRDEIEKFGKQARKTAEKYTWENYSKNINKIYERF